MGEVEYSGCRFHFDELCKCNLGSADYLVLPSASQHCRPRRLNGISRLADRLHASLATAHSEAHRGAEPCVPLEPLSAIGAPPVPVSSCRQYPSVPHMGQALSRHCHTLFLEGVPRMNLNTRDQVRASSRCRCGTGWAQSQCRCGTGWAQSSAGVYG